MKKEDIITQKEADKIGWKLFELRNEIDELEKPLKAFHECKVLQENKERWENRVFHNPKGGGIIYVQEVTKYSLRCIVLNAYYAKLDEDYHNSIGHMSYGAHFIINVDFSFDDMHHASEWIGVGNREYEDLVEKVKMMEEFFITKNKSI